MEAAYNYSIICIYLHQITLKFKAACCFQAAVTRTHRFRFLFQVKSTDTVELIILQVRLHPSACIRIQVTVKDQKYQNKRFELIITSMMNNKKN